MEQEQLRDLEGKDFLKREPTEGEVARYARSLGMTEEGDDEFYHIAREGWMAASPPSWKVCKNSDGKIYFVNAQTGEEQAEHPVDSEFRQRFRDAKSAKVAAHASTQSSSSCSGSARGAGREGLRDVPCLLTLAVMRAVRSFSVGAGVPFTLKFLAGVLPKLLAGDLARGAMMKQLAANARGSVPLGLSLGLFTLISRLGDAGGMSKAVAGTLAGLAAMGSFYPHLSGADSGRGTVALFFAAKMTRVLWAEAGWPAPPMPELVAMTLAAASLLTGLFMAPDCMSPGYVRFLTWHSGIPTAGIAAAAALCRARAVPGDEGLASDLAKAACALDAFWAGPPRRDGGGKQLVLPTGSALESLAVPCSLVHPLHPSCTAWVATNYIRGFVKALGVYGPVHLLPLLLSARKRAAVAADPLSAAIKLLVGWFRSSVFLAGYVNMGWLLLCASHNALGWSRWYTILWSALLSGLPVLVETSARRGELAAYCGTHGAECFLRTLMKHGWAPHVPFGEVALFGALASALVRLQGDNPDLLKQHGSWLATLAKFLLK